MRKVRTVESGLMRMVFVYQGTGFSPFHVLYSGINTEIDYCCKLEAAIFLAIFIKTKLLVGIEHYTSSSDMGFAYHSFVLK